MQPAPPTCNHLSLQVCGPGYVAKSRREKARPGRALGSSRQSPRCRRTKRLLFYKKQPLDEASCPRSSTRGGKSVLHPGWWASMSKEDGEGSKEWQCLHQGERNPLDKLGHKIPESHSATHPPTSHNVTLGRSVGHPPPIYTSSQTPALFQGTIITHPPASPPSNMDLT